MALIESINSAINGFVWGVPMLVLLVGTGILMTLRTRGVQFRKFGYAMKNTIGKIFHKTKAGKGEMTPFQAMSTALAGTVGTGNIAGITTAVTLGGPGAIFWLWVTALIGMCTKYAEVTLAVKFRERNKHGDWVGGPMYYIKNGLSPRWRFLAVLYSVFGVFTVFGTGNATQVNTITASINTALSSYGLLPADAVTLCRWIIGVAIALILMLVLLGGIKRIGRVTERLVPFMALLYVVLALGVVVLNAGRIPAVLGAIVTGAFSPTAVTGGIVGSFFTSMQKGVARGIFSNEAGLGTGSIAHACADTQEPVRQGLFGIFEVFADTIVICTLTALVILLSGVPVSYGQAAGAELTISGFVATYGNWVTIFTAVAMCCFAFSTIIGWGLYGARCVEFLFSSRAIAPFMVVYSLVAILGATADLGLLWSIAETFNGLMSSPNLIALFLLSGTLLRLVRGALDGGRAPRGRA